MTSLLARWILMAFAVFAASFVTRLLGFNFVAQVEGVGDFLILMLGVAVLAILNVTLGTLLRILTLPLNCMTLGLLSFVINALVLWLAASLRMGFFIDEPGGRAFLAALIASVLISIINGLLNGVVGRSGADD
ncbi:MAG TPA: phage holin family protein [Fimbriimonadaceae bacterium]|nr:phage holin family protein [Fimbriimonadaceae bacterium]